VIKYLDITDPGGDINLPGETYPGEECIWIGGGGEFWGAEGNQGVLPSDVDSTASFAIEIGLNHYNSGTDSIDFELLAATDEYAYDQLTDFMYMQHDINPSTSSPWVPVYYHSAPEPSMSILLGIGISIVLLRRRTIP
jgi:hypothetical protein